MENITKQKNKTHILLSINSFDRCSKIIRNNKSFLYKTIRAKDITEFKELAIEERINKISDLWVERFKVLSNPSIAELLIIKNFMDNILFIYFTPNKFYDNKKYKGITFFTKKYNINQKEFKTLLIKYKKYNNLYPSLYTLLNNEIKSLIYFDSKNRYYGFHFSYNIETIEDLLKKENVSIRNKISKLGLSDKKNSVRALSSILFELLYRVKGIPDITHDKLKYIANYYLIQFQIENLFPLSKDTKEYYEKLFNHKNKYKLELNELKKIAKKEALLNPKLKINEYLKAYINLNKVMRNRLRQINYKLKNKIDKSGKF